MMENDEITVFSQLKVRVEKALYGRRQRYTDFTVENFAQLETVFPGAYDLSQITYKLRSANGIYGLLVKPGGSSSGCCSSTDLKYRRNLFRQRLMYCTMLVHDEFLTTRNAVPPRANYDVVQNNDAASSSITYMQRWHADFVRNDNSLTPDIIPATLPLQLLTGGENLLSESEDKLINRRSIRTNFLFSVIGVEIKQSRKFYYCNV